MVGAVLKKHLLRLIQWEETGCHKHHRLMENHLYECIYECYAAMTLSLINSRRFNGARLKLCVSAIRGGKKSYSILTPRTRLTARNLPCSHIFKILRRRETRAIRQVQDLKGNIITRTRDVIDTVVTHLSQKYGPIDADSTSVTILQSVIRPVCQTKNADQLQEPVTSEEILTALRAGTRHKTPGFDGISLEFYTANWETIHTELHELLNQRFLHKNITPQQKYGVIICLPKSNGDQTPDHYRPIFLLNTEYKILARILARRLRHVLVHQLQHTQFCGVPRISILDAVSVVRDVIAHSEITSTTICVLTLDFQNTFDRISHQYLFHILRRYGISQWFIEGLHALYEHTTASVQVNGTLAGPISIQNGLRQGCPLSMVLYALCLHPLLLSVEENLPGLQIGRCTQCVPVLAYANDITVFVTQAADFSMIYQAVKSNELATGARLNPPKSKALAVGKWKEPATVLGIGVHDHVNILGVTLEPTVAHSTKDNWTGVILICAVRAQARKTYARNLCLAQRIQYVQLCLLVKIWYVAQISPPTHVQAQQLTTICTWFIWQGATFRLGPAEYREQMQAHPLRAYLDFRRKGRFRNG